MTHSRFLKNVLFAFSALLLSNSCLGQYGNYWIANGQSYFSFKIGKEGIYRINPGVLTSKGVVLSSINPTHFQLFKNGKEQLIFVAGESDNRFDADDFIEFYATPNDGSQETELYRQPTDQPNPYQSLFTDSATYFLTWNNIPSTKHINAFYDGNYQGKTSNNYFLENKVTSFKDYFFQGIPNVNNSSQQFSEYVGGEGFGRWIWSSQPEFKINLPQAYYSGPSTTIEVVAYSANHNTNEIIGGYNHELSLSIGNKNNVIKAESSLGYQKIQLNETISTTQIQPTTSFFIGETKFNQSAFVLSYIKCTYPRSFNLDGRSELNVADNFTQAYFEFTNYASAKSTPLIWDKTNQKRVTADKLPNQTIRFNLNSAGLSDFYIYDQADVQLITSLKAVNLSHLSIVQETDYLIITNAKLQSAAIRYKAYRESANGGNYHASIVYVDDLYNRFGYGIESPLALKRFINSLKSTQPKLTHILLLGKGQTYDRIRNNTQLKSTLNLVPSIGFPPSDYLYVSPLDGSSLSLDYAIGRIPARNNEQIDIYLDKLEAFESSTPSLWQKKIVQLAGGVGAENNSFKSYLDNYYSILSDTAYGGFRVLFSKSEPLPVQTSLTNKIIEAMNDGSNMLMYFGHGAAQVTEISLGEPYEYDNFGKTPLFFFNGCALGNTFEDLSLAERFLFEPNKGALGWIASTNLSFSGQLYRHTREIHQKLFKDNYGETIGRAIQEASSSFGNSNVPLDAIQSRQLVYHGDPAFSIKAPLKPDYRFSEVKVSHPPQSDSLRIDATIQNLGRAINKPLQVSCKVLNSNNELLYLQHKYTDAPHFEDPIQLNIPFYLLSGLITIQLELDSSNAFDELLPSGELNNTYETDYLIQEVSPSILKPTADEIINDPQLELLVQLPGLPDVEREIIIQWDTTPYFSIPIGTKKLTENKTLVESTIDVSTINKQDCYIRVSYIEDDDTSGWTYQTCGILNDESPGWTQGNRWKFFNAGLSALSVDSNTGDFDFLRSVSKDYQIETAGSGLGLYSSRWIIIDGTPVITNWWPANGVSMIFIDPDTDERYHEPQNSFNVPFKTPWFGNTPPPYNVVGQPCALYNYNTNEDIDQDSLIALLNRVPNGFHIIMLNMSNCNTELWKPELWTAFANYGVSKLQTIKEGEPFGVFGTKGNGQPATEYLADYVNSVTPPINQTMKYAQTFLPKVTEASIRSKIIGPALDWKTFSVEMDAKDASQESIEIDIYGSMDRKDWQKIQSVTNQMVVDLSSLDPQRYPYLQIKIKFIDPYNRTPRSIRRWKINYVKPAEGIINKDVAFEFHSDTLQQGEPLTLSLNFENISEQVFDSSTYIIYIQNKLGVNDTLKEAYIDSLSSFGNYTLKDTIETSQLEGGYNLYVGFNYLQEVTEQSYDNNYFNRRFSVQQDITNPLLDVVFDGKHIIDYDIVSPNTIITMSLKDNNAYLLMKEPSSITAYLEHPNGKIDTLNEYLENVSFTPSKSTDEPAILRYAANHLPTGEYKLSVIGKDATKNNSSKNGYIIHFKVIQEASITNFYPYPNPASNAVKFVYTLTGEEIPDQIQIQIMTVTGKVVREITRDELGIIRIGNNISEFTWDCTDQFGDRLANGVYLYRVKARLNGKKMTLRETAGDHFFVNGIGKLYIVK